MYSLYRMICIFCICVAASSFLLPRLSLADDGEKRVALIIGNGAYTVAPALANPTTDAKAVAAAFRRLGFHVIDGYDLTNSEMRAKLAEFSNAIADSKAAIVYYAGHGVSMDEENYLLPVDLALKSPTDLDLSAISLSIILKQMKREERVNVIILDACRDNPFAAELAHAKSRSVISDRGLTRVDSDLAKGTLIAFASDPKSTALDGKPGENSPFTKALLNHLEDPGVSIDTVMNRVRTEVWTTTGNRQMPWVNTSIIGEFVLNPRVAATPQHVASRQPEGDDKSEGSNRIITIVPAGPPAQPISIATANQDRLAQENRMWDSAEHGNSAEDYQAYLDAYPSGVYARMAKSRIARLRGTDEPAVVAGLEAGAETHASEAASAKSEIGNAQTERSLGMDLKKRRELQLRLQLLEYDPGKISGVFTEKTRSAITDWQNAHGYQPTGWLGTLQYLVLLNESEAPYGDFLKGEGTVHKFPQRSASRSLTVAHLHPQHYRRYHDYRRYHAARPAGDVGGAAFMGGLMGGALGGVIGHRF